MIGLPNSSYLVVPPSSFGVSPDPHSKVGLPLLSDVTFGSTPPPATSRCLTPAVSKVLSVWALERSLEAFASWLAIWLSLFASLLEMYVGAGAGFWFCASSASSRFLRTRANNLSASSGSGPAKAVPWMRLGRTEGFSSLGNPIATLS